MKSFLFFHRHIPHFSLDGKRCFDVPSLREKRMVYKLEGDIIAPLIKKNEEIKEKKVNGDVTSVIQGVINTIVNSSDFSFLGNEVNQQLFLTNAIELQSFQSAFDRKGPVENGISTLVAAQIQNPINNSPHHILGLDKPTIRKEPELVLPDNPDLEDELPEVPLPTNVEDMKLSIKELFDTMKSDVFCTSGNVSHNPNNDLRQVLLDRFNALNESTTQESLDDTKEILTDIINDTTGGTDFTHKYRKYASMADGNYRSYTGPANGGLISLAEFQTIENGGNNYQIGEMLFTKNHIQSHAQNLLDKINALSVGDTVDKELVILMLQIVRPEGAHCTAQSGNAEESELLKKIGKLADNIGIDPAQLQADYEKEVRGREIDNNKIKERNNKKLEDWELTDCFQAKLDFEEEHKLWEAEATQYNEALLMWQDAQKNLAEQNKAILLSGKHTMELSVKPGEEKQVDFLDAGAHVKTLMDSLLRSIGNNSAVEVENIISLMHAEMDAKIAKAKYDITSEGYKKAGTDKGRNPDTILEKVPEKPKIEDVYSARMQHIQAEETRLKLVEPDETTLQKTIDNMRTAAKKWFSDEAETEKTFAFQKAKEHADTAKNEYISRTDTDFNGLYGQEKVKKFYEYETAVQKIKIKWDAYKNQETLDANEKEKRRYEAQYEVQKEIADFLGTLTLPSFITGSDQHKFSQDKRDATTEKLSSETHLNIFNTPDKKEEIENKARPPQMKLAKNSVEEMAKNGFPLGEMTSFIDNSVHIIFQENDEGLEALQHRKRLMESLVNGMMEFLNENKGKPKSEKDLQKERQKMMNALENDEEYIRLGEIINPPKTGGFFGIGKKSVSSTASSQEKSEATEKRQKMKQETEYFIKKETENAIQISVYISKISNLNTKVRSLRQQEAQLGLKNKS